MAEKFEYKYSAPTPEERREINAIRDAYLPKEKNQENLDRLRKLDKKVKNVPLIFSICFGVIGILIFGTGLTCVLEWNQILIGIIVMVVGALGVGLAIVAHKLIYSKLKAKYKDEILELSNDLLEEK